MLTHRREAGEPPSRVVVLGAAGFVGGAAARHMEAAGIPVLGLGRVEIDLLAVDAAERLAVVLRPSDTLVVTSARAPCRTPAMLVENTRMIEAVCRAVETKPPAHLVYVSSDAVYADQSVPLTERSCAEPGSLHGAMHLAREIMLKATYPGPLAILRPTLINGTADPHDGYGPNRFRRLALAGENIVLFGEGEEMRDHVSIDDVAELIHRIVLRRSHGVLNAATGQTMSFREIAERIVALTRSPVRIIGTPRQGPMPHNGYRAFDIAGCREAFPDFAPTGIAEGLGRTCRAP
ncbi:NAD-dependent dehydratase [Skermanella stibiiresistens SB22]|uniref:NAD-dependent dehydratase n=1 Tax=Skermanella stibiiresistens SB22 TaxID=1385369 RepID=W9HCR4_9PROT|nr:NAD-dependent epimerase/dehydratase family protein [Skermanella stibiiresistens]EWY42526.1 NAD-dependent dehydratase [Skermanella stibiiresistens SB22]